MKHKAVVWTLSWDTQSGTDCRVFGTEREWLQFFSNIIEESIEDIETQQATEIRLMLAAEEIGLAYDIWQDSYKPDLDTYNWDSMVIDVEILNTDTSLSIY